MNLKDLANKTEELLGERLVRTVQWRAGRRQIKMKSDRAGYKTSSGQEVRMKGVEKRKRKLGAKRAVRKKRAIQSQIQRKRERTLKIRDDR